MKGSIIQVDANNHGHCLLDNAHLHMRSMLAFLKDFSCRGPIFTKNSVVESWTVANPFLFLWVVASSLDRVSLHNSVLESTDLALSVARNLQCFSSLCPWSCTWLQQRQRRAFQVVFHMKRNASHEFAVPSIGPPYLKSGVAWRDSLSWTVSWMHRDSSGFSCTNCWSWRNNIFSTISSSGSFFIAIVVSSLRVLKDCTPSFSNSTFANHMEVHDRFVCVVDLDKIICHPCYSPSREKAFFCVQLLLMWRLFFRSLRWWSSWDHSLLLNQEPRSLPATWPRWWSTTSSDRQLTSRIPSRWSKSLFQSDDLHNEEVPLLTFSRQILAFLISSQASTSSLSAHTFWEVASLHTCSVSSTGTLERCVDVGVSPGHGVMLWLSEMDRQAVTHCSKRTPLHSFKVVSSALSPPLPVEADPGWFSSTCTHMSS